MKRTSVLYLEDLRKNRNLDYISNIWFAIMNMDSNALRYLLDHNMTYEDMSKDDFIELLNDRFNSFKSLGDTEFILDFDICNLCNPNTPICKFIGNISGEHFGLYFEIEKGQITDIYHCNWYGGTYPF